MTTINERKYPAHGVFTDGDKRPLVFITVCTQDRGTWLATNYYHDLLLEIWKQASFWRVGRYVIMPDHIHLFAAQYEPDFAFEKWMRYWRSQWPYAGEVFELIW